MKTLLQKLKTNLKNSKFLKDKKRMLLLVFFVCALSLVGYSIPSKIVITYGNSVDGTLFWKQSYTKLEKQNYVIVQSSPDDIFAKGRTLTKKIVCSPGDILTITADSYFCNDEYLGRAKRMSKTGIPVVPFNPCKEKTENSKVITEDSKPIDASVCKYTIPPKHYFVMGDHKDSYDSRYFGLVHEENIKARLYKIW